jgi:hypothetical protein
MKKIIAFIIFLFASTICFAQDTAFSKQDTSKVTFTKVYNDVKTSLNTIGSALKVGSEHVYKVLIRQQEISATVDLIFLIIFSIGLFVCLKLIFKILRKLDKPNKDLSDLTAGEQGMFIVSIIIGVISLLLIVICLCCNLTDIITGFFNPEYGALKEILNHL